MEYAALLDRIGISTLISFWNEIHQICQKAQVNSTVVGKIVSMDPRISAYGAVMHGKPFGGFCLPKDLNALITTAELVSFQPLLLEAVRQVNEHMGAEPAGRVADRRRALI